MLFQKQHHHSDICQAFSGPTLDFFNQNTWVLTSIQVILMPTNVCNPQLEHIRQWPYLEAEFRKTWVQILQWFWAAWSEVSVSSLLKRRPKYAPNTSSKLLEAAGVWQFIQSRLKQIFAECLQCVKNCSRSAWDLSVNKIEKPVLELVIWVKHTLNNKHIMLVS